MQFLAAPEMHASSQLFLEFFSVTLPLQWEF
jgi:hypothetical protein